jgi:hypothetical protein
MDGKESETYLVRVLSDGGDIIAETCSRDRDYIVMYTWAGLAQ